MPDKRKFPLSRFAAGIKEESPHPHPKMVSGRFRLQHSSTFVLVRTVYWCGDISFSTTSSLSSSTLFVCCHDLPHETDVWMSHMCEKGLEHISLTQSGSLHENTKYLNTVWFRGFTHMILWWFIARTIRKVTVKPPSQLKIILWVATVFFQTLHVCWELTDDLVHSSPTSKAPTSKLVP